MPSIQVDVVEHGLTARRGRLRCEIGQNLEFNTASLESYFFAGWKPVVFDAMLLAAAVEFCDRTQRRPATGWGRSIDLSLPVHQPDRWNEPKVKEALHDALTYLTGDLWNITFNARKYEEAELRQGRLSLSNDVSAVIPFSDGLDSLALSGIMERTLGNKLVRIRLGSRNLRSDKQNRSRQPFTSVPYKLSRGDKAFVESSVRSRGFKFAIISGIAAYLAEADTIIIPEGGQGALGPALVTVGQAYPDYRSHPAFTLRMERFFSVLLEKQVQFKFPRIWNTKGETLEYYISGCDKDSTAWETTWSCWQQARQVAVQGKKRQCGICAACLLRRLSVHAAACSEPPNTYVWENLSAPTFEVGAAASFDRKNITQAMHEYAIAGVLHLDHLAGLRNSPTNAAELNLNIFKLAETLGIDSSQVKKTT